MKKQIYLIPKSGLKVIDPVTRLPLASGGEYVDKTVYWQRRIKCGDVIQYGPDEMKKQEVKPEEKTEINDEQQFEEVGGDQ